MVIIKKKEKKSVGEDVEKMETLCIAIEIFKKCNYNGKQDGSTSES